MEHMRQSDIGGVHIIPKHRLALHLWARAPETGNPKEFANWYDEHLMATLASVAQKAYSAVYERRVLSHFELSYESQLRK
eukprot:3524309-Heterocapsa_arctica.AAC.1